MKVSTGVRRALLAAGVATTVLAPSSAHAFYIMPTVGNCGQLGRQICYGAGQPVPIGLATLRVVFECSAASPFVVDRTGVACYLVGLSDNKQYAYTGPLFTVGNQSTIPNILTEVPFQAYKLCVGAGYSTATGGYQPVQGFTCFQ